MHTMVVVVANGSYLRANVPHTIVKGVHYYNVPFDGPRSPCRRRVVVLVITQRSRQAKIADLAVVPEAIEKKNGMSLRTLS